DAFVTKINAAGSGLVYSTYLGGNGDDHAYGIAVNSAGSAYIAGFTQSTNFPTADPFQAAYGGGIRDAFVAKLSGSGTSLAYSSYIGGNDYDNVEGVAIDSAGNAYVSGYTASANFPTANALQPTYGGNYDAFVAKIATSDTSPPLITNVQAFPNPVPI